jgi:hypothetical protein
MAIIRSPLEIIAQMDFEKTVVCPDQYHRIWNTSVIRYARKNPTTGEQCPVYKWDRFSAAWKGTSFAHPKWEETQYQYPYLTNEQILKHIKGLSMATFSQISYKLYINGAQSICRAASHSYDG